MNHSIYRIQLVTRMSINGVKERDLLERITLLQYKQEIVEIPFLTLYKIDNPTFNP